MFDPKDLFALALRIENPWFIERMEFDPKRANRTYESTLHVIHCSILRMQV